MTWAIDRRLDFIDIRLATAGQIQRADIMQAFDISEAQASGDINEFLRLYPDALAYDKSAKRYVPANGRYRPQRKLTPRQREALIVLTRWEHKRRG